MYPILIVAFSMVFFSSSISLSQKTKYDFFNKAKFTFDSIELNKIQRTKVKKRSLYSAYYTPDGKLPKKKILVEEIHFNKAGNPTVKTQFNSFGKVRNKSNYKYDNRNRLISEEVLNEFNNVSLRKEITYNVNGDTAEIIIKRNRKAQSDRKRFEYAENGMLSKQLRFETNDKMYQKDVYSYINGSLAKVEYFDGEEKKNGEILFVYNDYGNIITEKINNAAKTYSYDDQNRLIKTVHEAKIRTYKYDSKGNIIEDQFFIENTKRQFKIVFNYLKNGLVDQAIRYDAKDRKAFYSNYEYEYYK